MSVADLGERVSALELAEWQAYFELTEAVSEHVAGGVDPKVAADLVWRPVDDDD